MNWETASKGTFASNVVMEYILRYDGCGKDSVTARECVMHIGVKRGGAWVRQWGKRFVLDKE